MDREENALKLAEAFRRQLESLQFDLMKSRHAYPTGNYLHSSTEDRRNEAEST